MRSAAVKAKDAANQKAKRDRRRAEGRCPRCGDPLPDGTKRQNCGPCLAVMSQKLRFKRQLARLGAEVWPVLENAVRLGEPVWLSPAESRKMLQAMEARPR